MATTQNTPTRIVRCPGCGASTRFDPSNEYRPFCSNRCKNVDISNWASGKYAVPAEPVDQDSDRAFEDSENPNNRQQEAD